MKISNKHDSSIFFEKIPRKSFGFIDIIVLFFISENLPHENHNAHLYCQDKYYDATLLLCTIAEYRTHVYQPTWSRSLVCFNS